MKDVKARLGELVRRWFAPREIIIRTSGRIQFICLSTRAQFIATTVLGGVVLGALGASINLAIEQLHQYSRDIAVRQAESAYNELLTAFGDYVERAGDSIAAADAEVAALAARANPGGSALSTPAQSGDMLASLSGRGDAALKSALRDRLTMFEADLRKVSERNKLLVGELSVLKRELQQAQFDRDTAIDARQAKAAQLAEEMNKTRTLGERGAALQRELAEVTARGAGAETRINSLNAKVASLDAELRDTNRRAGDIEEQARQLTVALNTAIEQRNRLQNERARMAGTVGELRQQLASLQESQANFVANLAERARDNIEDMEKTVAMTGLDVDKLLQSIDQESGEGGPFIPVPAGTNDEGEQKLLASVASLGDQVERWEKLRLILRTLPLTAPIDSYYISSMYGTRTDPFNGARALHEGVDMVSKLRSEVLATAPGTVTFAGWKGGYGRLVEIDHGLGIVTRYAHLHAINVKVGDVVDYRQEIGKLGSSGRSSGPHVHFEVRYNGRPLDPMAFLKAGRYVFKG
ncbi:M23 family metallopeptidase [Dongia deserti]|uniref:M23 family metallopeptidase n=1 Tax=Dongia deserti TaxID=2268030 RepID=UPI00254995E9|nr:M23 family metallopeptidase [Dongia deserti]